jgi:hypothetical protein
MKTLLLTVKLLIWGYLSYLLVFLGTSYHPENAAYSPPFLLFVIDTINLFVHEAGHFFFKLFGQWVYVMGGSMFQVLLPLALVIVTWRQNVGQIGFPAFWMGESMVNVSVYIRDAPYKKLHLIARGLIHDWNWLLSGNFEAAEPLGDVVFGLGILVCSAAVAFGVYFAIQTFRSGRPFQIPE